MMTANGFTEGVRNDIIMDYIKDQAHKVQLGKG
jgi:hypothetical protein